MALKTPFPDDKHAHLIGCMMIMGVCIWILKLDIPISLLIVFTIGALVELAQKFFKEEGFFDWNDMVYNMAGAGVIGAIFGLINIFI